MRELMAVFLRLGLTSFGGPAAHIALMESELVGRRRWLTREEFLDLVAVSMLLPGPTSTELALHIGHRRLGWRGLAAVGLVFIGPAAVCSGVLGHLYVRTGGLPDVSRALAGLGPAVLAIVAVALWRLLPGAWTQARTAVAFGVAVAAGALGVHELGVLGIGAVTALAASGGRPGTPKLIAVALLPSAGAAAGAAASPGLGALFLLFLKIGSVLFGSGYVLLAFLRADLVERLRWLTDAQLVDAIAVGQITPGPLFSTATFIGYLLAGPPGAAVATIAIFLPAFVFVAASGPLVRLIRASPAAAVLLDGVVAGSLALMAIVTVQLGISTVTGPLTAGIGLASLVLLAWGRVNPALCLLAGALAGWLGG